MSTSKREELVKHIEGCHRSLVRCYEAIEDLPTGNVVRQRAIAEREEVIDSLVDTFKELKRLDDELPCTPCADSMSKQEQAVYNLTAREILNAASGILSKAQPLCVTDSLSRRILMMIANLAAREVCLESLYDSLSLEVNRLGEDV